MKILPIRIFFIIALGVLAIPINAEQLCQLPTQLQTWDYDSSQAIRSGKDWQNKTTQTDYWMLSLSWSKAFCDKFTSGVVPAHAQHQCVSNKFGLIVHGLWAQSRAAGKNSKGHPRNCRNAPAISTQRMKEHLCEMPGVRLMQMQWEKHGTCDFNSAQDYLAKTSHLYRRLNLPDRETLEALEYSSWKRVKKKIVQMNASTGLRDEHVYVKFRKKRLHEVYICYDLDDRYTACP